MIGGDFCGFLHKKKKERDRFIHLGWGGSSFLAGYARQGDAMLAWADICRAADSEQLCCELPVVSRIG